MSERGEGGRGGREGGREGGIHDSDESQDNGTVKMQGEEVATVDYTKYPGSTVQSNGECG